MQTEFEMNRIFRSKMMSESAWAKLAETEKTLSLYESLQLSLFSFESLYNFVNKDFEPIGNYRLYIWGYSSAGRAPALQAGGQEFDSLYLHQCTLKTI